MSGMEPAMIAALSTAASTGIGMYQSAQGAKTRNKAAMARYQREQRQAALEKRIKERKIERERRRKLAAQRARFGSAGISSLGGSAGAVYAGLNKEFDTRKSDLNAAFNLARTERPDLLDPSSDMLRQGLAGADKVVGLLGD